MTERKPRTAAQKASRKTLDQKRRAENIRGGQAQPDPEKPPVPPLLVQRMGKKFRIVYKETRNLARFNSGDPVDDGGFESQEGAMIHLSRVTDGLTTADPEAENVEA